MPPSAIAYFVCEEVGTMKLSNPEARTLKTKVTKVLLSPISLFRVNNPHKANFGLLSPMSGN